MRMPRLAPGGVEVRLQGGVIDGLHRRRERPIGVDPGDVGLQLDRPECRPMKIRGPGWSKAAANASGVSTVSRSAR